MSRARVGFVALLTLGCCGERVVAKDVSPPRRAVEFSRASELARQPKAVPRVRDARQKPSRDRRSRRGSVSIVLPEPPPVPPPAIIPAGETAGRAHESCVASLREAGHVADVIEAPRRTSEACVIAQPVRLESVAANGAQRIALPDKPTLSCAFARTFSEFAGRLAAPLGEAHLGAGVVSIATGPGYECRGRNRVAAAKISANGKGIALDIASFRLADGRVVSVEKPREDREKKFLLTLRTAACGWFTTVLGPGADAAHANHLHLDTEMHGSSARYRLCQ